MDEKKPEIKIIGSGIEKDKGPEISFSWETVTSNLTEEELESAKQLNWEWYYNCYLHLDEPLLLHCKRCGRLNLFEPRRKWRKCDTCGYMCKRCEKEEDLGETAGESGKE